MSSGVRGLLRGGVLPRRARSAGVLFALLLPAIAGCYSERSFPMRPGDYLRIPAMPAARFSRGSVRAWLQYVHARFKHLLPARDESKVLLPDDLQDWRGTIDVYRHFGLVRSHLTSIWFNNAGLAQSAQVTRKKRMIDERPPAWPGFSDVWIPINERLRLAGRLGRAECGGAPRYTDCIVLIPGLLGDNALQRTRDIAIALRDSGLHVLALELRGYGQTEARYPDVYYSYGVLETGDLLAVAEWLQRQPYVRDTGLIGFCWGANEALLTAWEDGRPDDDPSVSPRLRPYLRRRSAAQHYRAGVIAFSPVLNFEQVLSKLEHNWSMLADPVLNRLQSGVDARAERKHFPELYGSLRKLVEYEARHTELDYPQAAEDGMRYLRFLPHDGQPAHDKLGYARMPVLIVHAANDPLGSAQAVAELLARTDNPRVSGLILPGGGHNGFPAYSRAYFYNLVLHFFDAQPCPLEVAAHTGSAARAHTN